MCVVAVVVMTTACGEGSLRLEADRVSAPGYRLKVPTGFERGDVGPPTSARVVGLKGPEGQREAPTIRHTDDGPTAPPDEQQCSSDAKARAEMGAVAKAMGQGSEVDPWRIESNPVLGKVCAFTVVGRARSMAFREFHVLHHGYRVICEADETAAADALCDAYLGSASKP